MGTWASWYLGSEEGVPGISGFPDSDRMGDFDSSRASFRTASCFVEIYDCAPFVDFSLQSNMTLSAFKHSSVLEILIDQYAWNICLQLELSHGMCLGSAQAIAKRDLRVLVTTWILCMRNECNRSQHHTSKPEARGIGLGTLHASSKRQRGFCKDYLQSFKAFQVLTAVSGQNLR